MKRLFLFLMLLAMLTQPSLAFRPAGWVYASWPWAYDPTSGDWFWFNTPSDPQWVNGFPPANGWQKMPQSGLATGWSFYQWPYAYGQNNSAWHYINEVDAQWVVNMRTGAWSRFGSITIPSGMALIPAGTNTGNDPDFGAYSLTVVNAFYMDKYEVTKALWDEVRDWSSGNGYTYDSNLTTEGTHGQGKAADHPVHTVNWYDCVKWCNARSQKEGRAPVYYTDSEFTHVYKAGQVPAPFVNTSATGYRLPTDVQWEYAARGGVTGRRFPWGSDTIQHTQANYYSSAAYIYDTSMTRGFHPAYTNGVQPFSSPVGSFDPNAYGLYDMAGNVWEWCLDWYPGDEGSYRLFHGGSWSYHAVNCRIGVRSPSLPANASYSIGFRTCLPKTP